MGIFERFRLKKEIPSRSKTESSPQSSLAEWMKNKDTLFGRLDELREHIGELKDQEADDYVKGLMAVVERKDVTAGEAQEIMNGHLAVIKKLRESNKLKEFYQKIAPPGREVRGKDLSEAIGRLGEIIKKESGGFGAIGITLVIAVIVLIGGGFFAYQYFQLQKIQEETKPPAAKTEAPPSSTETQPQTEEIDTSAWKTYYNDKFAFKVKYPSDWEVTETFFQTSPSALKSFDSVVIHPIGVAVELPEKFINIGGTYDARGVKKRCALLEKPLFKCQEINNIPLYTASKEQSVLRVFEAILQNIHSGDRVIDTSSWKTYRNEKYGFEMKYPSAFNIKDNGTNAYSQLLENNNPVFSFFIYENRSVESLLECGTPDNPAANCEKGNFTTNGITYQTLNYKKLSERGEFLGYRVAMVGKHTSRTLDVWADLGKDITTRDEKLEELDGIFSTFKFTK